MSSCITFSTQPHPFHRTGWYTLCPFRPVSVGHESVSKWGKDLLGVAVFCCQSFSHPLLYLFVCLFFIASQGGIMPVRKPRICSCGRSCQSDWPTPWERSTCCLTSCSASRQSNWCRSGEYGEPASRATPRYAGHFSLPFYLTQFVSMWNQLAPANAFHHWALNQWLLHLRSRRTCYCFRQRFCSDLYVFVMEMVVVWLSLQVHAKLFRSAGVWEQEARGSTSPAWVSELS